MPEMKIVDKDGEWFVNRAVFRMVDPSRGEGNEVIFEPGEPTKVKKTEWMGGQSMIVACPDPVNSDEPIPGVIQPTDSTLVPNDDVTGKPDPNGASGIAGTAASTAPKKK